VKSDRTASHVMLGAKTGKPPFYFQAVSERFVDVGSVDNFIAKQENKATLQTAQRDVNVLKTFLGTRNELRKRLKKFQHWS